MALISSSVKPLAIRSMTVAGRCPERNACMAEMSCGPVAGKVTDSTDCDDANPSRHPGAPEMCNAVDDTGNCMVLWKARVLDTGRFTVRVHSSTGTTHSKIITISRPGQ